MILYYKIILLTVFIAATPNIYADNVTQKPNLKQRQLSADQKISKDCGRLPTININEKDTEELYGSIPWNVGIYQINNNAYRIICEGTLIASNLVVSAAQCFWQEGLKAKVLTNLNEYKVIVGKYEQNNLIIDSESPQVIDVGLIYLNEDFFGLSKYYANDIAVIVLSVNIIISDNVLPVCVDWTNQHNNPRGPGQTIGLGETENKIPSSVIYLSYITRNRCQTRYKNGFKLYLTADKFCASPESEVDDRKVVIGAGLAFKYENNLHFLTGVASVKNPDPEDTITAFTNIKQYIPWIQSIYKNHTGMDPASMGNKITMNSSNNSPSKHSSNEHICVIPTTNSDAYYLKNQDSILSPGSEFNSLRGEVEIHCKEGYSSLSNNNLIFCWSTGKWYPDGFDKLCMKRCQPIVSEGMIMKYTYNGEKVDGSNPMMPGTNVKPECNTTIYKIKNPETYRPKILNCLPSGYWSDEINFRCVPKCGLQIHHTDNMMAEHGKEKIYNPMPWSVGVYMKNDTSNIYELICGGTLISQNLVVSAAQCFEVSENMNLKYKIGIGKITANISVMDNEYSQIFNVKNVSVHHDYSSVTFVYDIAVIVLSSNIQFSSTDIMPVCMDWNDVYENIPNEIEGNIASWEINENYEVSSDILVKNVPLIDRKTCLNHFSANYKNFLWIDKFCARYLSGTEQNAQKLVGGAGLTRIHNKLHYFTGILCLNDPDSKHSMTAFTRVGFHIKWLLQMYINYSKL